MRRLLLPLLACLLAACGSTAQLQGGGSPGATGLAAPATTSTPATASPTGSEAIGGTAGAGGTASAPAALGSPPSPVAPIGATSAPVPGIEGPASHTPVEVGAIVESSDSSLAGSLGFSGLNNGDEQAALAALFTGIDKQGGLAGHPITPVYYVVSATDTRPYSEIEQAACDNFTQDHHVVAVLGGHFVASDNTLLACDQKAAVLTVNSEVTYTGDSATFSSYPDYVAPAGLELDRQARAYVDGMAAQAFFHQGVDTGLLAVDVPAYHRVISAVVVPELARFGVHLKDVSYFPETSSTSGTTQSAAGIASAELRFASDGIGQVLFLDDAGLGALEFMTVANVQHYLPRYALSTSDAPQAQEANASPTELANASGIGWAPILDVDLAQEQGATPPSQQRCLNLLTAAGQDEHSQNTALIGATLCDEAWFLQAAAQHVGGALTAAALLQGALQVGAGYASAVVPQVTIDAQQRDGVTAYRPFAYATSCKCFRYTGPAVPIN